MEPSAVAYFRRFFVYLCAFVGAAWFGDWAWSSFQLGNGLSGEFTAIILASAWVAGLFAWRGPRPSSAETALFEDLRWLAGLRDDGIISDEEFAAKKRQLLGL